MNTIKNTKPLQTIVRPVNIETNPIYFPVKEWCFKNNVDYSQGETVCCFTHENLRYLRCIEDLVYRLHRKSVQPEWKG